MTRDNFLTSEQVADALSVTPQTIRNWIRKGALPAERYGHVFRIHSEDFTAFAGKRADRASPARQADVWAPEGAMLPRRRARRQHSVWDEASVVLPRRRS
jgi:excisionase family DNA binding protein